MTRIPLLVAVTLLVTAAASGAIVTGNVSGRVTDRNDASLAGVVVTIAGPSVERRATTGASGAYAFVELPPADYVVQAESKTNGTVIRTSVDVDAGRTTTVDFKLDRAPEETVTESRETALLDPSRVAFTTPWNPTELSLLPLGRHAPALFDRVPGVSTSVVDVGGSAFGTDVGAVIRGAGPSETEWTVDGVRTSRSSVLTGFGPDGLQQVAITTSAPDVRLRAYGGEMSVVPRRGTEDITGFAAAYWSDSDLLGGAGDEDRDGMRLDRRGEAELGFGSKLFTDRAHAFGAVTARDIARVAWRGGASADDRYLHGFARFDGRPADRIAIGFLFVGSDQENGDTASLEKLDGAFQLGESLHVTAFAAQVDDVRGDSTTQGEVRGSFISGRHSATFGVNSIDASDSTTAIFAGDSISFSRATVYAGARVEDGATTVVAPRLSASIEVPAERPTILRLFAGRYAGAELTEDDRADEYLVDLEQQLVPELTFGATAVHRRFEIDSTSLNEVDAYVRKRLSNSFLVRGFVSWFDSERPFVPEWSYALSGVAQLPRDMMITFSWHGRQETELDASAASLDVRFGKTFTMDPFEATFALDLFNAAGERAGSSRLARLGVDLRF